MRILVTGGAGFLGSVLTSRLIHDHHEVTVVDTLSASPRSAAVLASLGADVVQGDVRDRSTVDLVADQDAVVHLAAVVGYPACDAEPDLAESVNVGATEAIAAAVRPEQTLVFASTGSVYGAQEEVCSEFSTPDPRTHYGRTKLAAEKAVAAAGGTSLRFATLMGPSPAMRFDLLPNDLTYQAVQGQAVEIFQADAHRTFLDVRDAALACEMLLEMPDVNRPPVVNVGDQRLNLTKRQLGELIGEITGNRPSYVDGLEDPDQRDYDVDYTVMRACGFTADRSLRQSLTDIARLARMCPAKDWLHV